MMWRYMAKMWREANIDRSMKSCSRDAGICYGHMAIISLGKIHKFIWC